MVADARQQDTGRFARISTALVAGIVCGFLSVVLSIGNGSLLFSGSLQTYLPTAVGLSLFSMAAVAAITALTSSIPGAVGVVQEVPVIALGVAVTAVAGALPADIAGAGRYATIMAAIGIGTGAAGVLTLVLGVLRVGAIIRFVPYPVVGGFLAGTGWLILLGGAGLVLGSPFSLTAIATVLEPVPAERFLAAGVFVAVIAFAQRRTRNPLAVPAIIFGAIVVFNLLVLATGTTGATLRASGWVINLPEGGRLWPSLTAADLGLVDWHAVTAGLVSLPTLVAVTAITMLMNASGIELESDRDVDLDRELKSVGLANIAAGLGGGLPGYYALSLTLLAERLGAQSRLVGLTTAAVAIAALALGGVVLDAIPTFVLGGMLIWMGGALMFEWLFAVYGRIGLLEYAVIFLIFAVIVGFGFAAGFLAGLIAALMLFAFEYGRIDIVRHEVFGKDSPSNFETSQERAELLTRYGAAILIMRLQGFLFFGTADRLRRRVQDRLAAGAEAPQYLLLDFRRVTGIDSSAILSFIRLEQAARRIGATVLLAALSPAVESALARGGLRTDPASAIRIEPDFERALRWSEDSLLKRIAPDLPGEPARPLALLLSDVVGEPELAALIAGYCEPVEAGPGDRIIDQGDPSDDIFFVEHGLVAVEARTAGNQAIRLATVGHGGTVGEIAFYTGSPRTASVTAEGDVKAWRLSRDSLARLDAEAPAAALKFHRGIAAMLARRLARADRLIRSIAD